jgi:hypothetical protein
MNAQQAPIHQRLLSNDSVNNGHCLLIQAYLQMLGFQIQACNFVLPEEKQYFTNSGKEMEIENFTLPLVNLNTVTKSTLAIRTERNTMQRTQELCILLDTLFVTHFPHLKLKKLNSVA